MYPCIISNDLRDDVRRDIDRLLAADSGPFATARRAAVLAAAEKLPSINSADALNVIDACVIYENRRGGWGKPSAAAVASVNVAVQDQMQWGNPAIIRPALAAYERARGMK